MSVLSSELVYCGQAVRWIKMPVGREIGLGPDDIVLDMGTQLLPLKKGHSSPQFLARVWGLLMSKMDQDAT